jgi:sugar lactone lactonase YvrE
MKNVILPILLFFVCGLILVFEASAHPSWAIAVDSRNRIYVSDLEKVWKIEADGKVSIAAERHTHELTLDRADNLIAEELHYEPSTQKYTAAIWRITPSGEFSFILAPTETPPKGIGIWKNEAGVIFYSGQTETEPPEFYLLKRNADGRVKVLFGDERKALAHRQILPYVYGGMAFAADGAVYFKNREAIWKAASDDKISVVADKQQILSIAPNPMLFGLAVDAENNVFTADFNSKTILKIAADKKISAIYKSEKDWTPTGVYARNKNLYVLESKNLPPNSNPVSRVRKIAADGKVSIVATVGETQTNAPANSIQNNSISANQNQSNNKSCAAMGLAFVAGLISSEICRLRFS